ncbi:hypothetical protein JVT61DRAFT_6852 [Boletus reticuloceps]|uniref:Uncharacterized protein n=1 Tax=Boletus reticuloceps TaxID=495285 RepID=A0A8I2YK37_9AGAM|nr:hypothetical protein JVT61DRAFT_6852 [Boletus reticuloceps]
MRSWKSSSATSWTDAGMSRSGLPSVSSIAMHFLPVLLATLTVLPNIIIIQLAAVHLARFKKQRDEIERTQAERLLHDDSIELTGSAESHQTLGRDVHASSHMPDF